MAKIRRTDLVLPIRGMALEFGRDEVDLREEVIQGVLETLVTTTVDY